VNCITAHCRRTKKGPPESDPAVCWWRSDITCGWRYWLARQASHDRCSRLLWVLEVLVAGYRSGLCIGFCVEGLGLMLIVDLNEDIHAARASTKRSHYICLSPVIWGDKANARRLRE